MALSCYQQPAPAVRTVLVPAAAAPRVRPPEVLWHPDAVRRPLPADMGGPLTLSRGLVLHVQAGDGSPHGWFNREDVRASSHWWVGKAGGLEQYVPADRVAWTQGAGNSAWHSVETEGWPDEQLTYEQIATLGRLYRWGHDHWGWALHLAEEPGGTGLGWHGMGGPSWGHTACPGEPRKAQRPAILAAALGGAALGLEDTMRPSEWTEADRLAAATAIWAYRPPDDVRQGSMHGVVAETYRKAGHIQAPLLRDLAADVAALRAGLSAAAPAAAEVMAAHPLDVARQALAGLDLTDTVQLAAEATSRAAWLLTPPPEEGSDDVPA